ncbi:catalase family protein [Neolewinella aurantiaca]|uniref:Catalase family protein n=1 Tax=Neolewinella aurantiaca TaxID=2602767 RepID=A0A5C7FZR4_9BACT|nr:catalase family protein [Neolewinella aurantiaca]TXF90808.1 catalase family protein [Neolewinella aurantiaca]
MRFFFLLLLLIFFLSSCGTTKGMPLATEDPPANEKAATEEIIALLKATLEESYPDPAATERDAHPKQHGLVKAEFVIADDIPEAYRIGIFSEPKTYQSWLRYSKLLNGPDIDADSHGLAIKLMGVPGQKILPGLEDAPTHDFVFMSTQIFVTKGVKGFADLLSAVRKKNKLNAAWHFLTHPRLLRLFMKVQIKAADLTAVEWGSTTPYLLGEHAVKYAVLPRTSSDAERPDKKTAEATFLTTRLAETLASGPVELDFFIQVQTDARKMPIEDARVEWDRSLSPFIRVATVRILQQEFTSAEQQAYGQNLSFSPWHALPAHRPLGGINRGRRAIYDQMSKFRHGRTGGAMAEPAQWREF